MAMLINKPDIVLTRYQGGQSMSLYLEGNKIQEFQAAIDKALNCGDQLPQWLFDLSDALNPNPVPKRLGRETQREVNG